MLRRTPSLEQVLEAVAAAARAERATTYLVGGFVRDRLLGGAESKDIDLLLTSGDGASLLGRVAGALGWSPPQTFDRFGTAQVRGDGFIVEAVRARAERYDPASRKPDVRPGTLEDDIWRRDFTVNALCQTLEGEILDITGQGLEDLRAGVLRTPVPAAETFSEDPLRMMRAARLRAQLGFSTAPGLLEAMRAQASRIAIVSIERVAEELRRLLTSPHPRAGFEVLREGGLLAKVLPEVQAMVGVEQSGYHVHDVYQHTVHALDAAPPELIIRTAVLLHDVGKPPTHRLTEDGRHTFHGHDLAGSELAERILLRLRFSGEEIRAICTMVRLHLRPIAYRDESFGDAAVRRLIRQAGELLPGLLELARADTRASAYPDLDNLDALEARIAELDRRQEISRLVSPLTGEELMAMAERGPGPWVGRAKRALEEAIIEGELSPGDGEAARRWLAGRPELLAD